MNGEHSNDNQWRKLASQVSSKINLAWWLDKLSTPLLIAALAGSCLILIARRELTDFSWFYPSIIGAIILLAIGLLSWWRARGNFESPDHALVRMEASMKMCNKLSAAKQGLTPWPAIPKVLNDGTRWRWPRLLSPPLAALILLGASILLPVSTRSNAGDLPMDEPQAWKDLEADIESLTQEETVEKDYLEELEERIEQLRGQNQEEWYSHSSIEATDALREMHQGELDKMERNLRRAEQALESLQENSGEMSDQSRERILDAFSEALEQLEQGKMKPNRELLEKIKALDPENLAQLEPQQLEQLRESMKQSAKNCAQCPGGAGKGPSQDGGASQDWLDDLLNEGSDNGQPQEREGGKGGVNRGPGSAPGVLGQISPDVNSGDLEGLQSEDLSKSLPGDLLELRDSKHDVDKTKVGLRAGGNVDNESEGGSRVWKESLLPSEKRALKNFFK